jgi:hypothetical protein
MPRVATANDIVTTLGTDLTFGQLADTGTWSAAPIDPQPDPKLAIGPDPVIQQVTCTFTFSGTRTVGTVTTKVDGTSDVKLSASSTTLRGSHQGQPADVLVDGDSAHDDYGNMLTVKVAPSSKLATGTSSS